MSFSGRGGSVVDDRARNRRVKLWCPSVAKMVAMVVGREEERVDLGSIARVFGLEPATVKLNGHFIGRGADLVASSVTWRSLLKFFASKGLATGLDGASPLVVDGKLCKIGAKRPYNPQDAASTVHQPQDNGLGGRLQEEDISFHVNKRLKDTHSGYKDGKQVTKWNGLGIKRKQLGEYVQLLKKLKINDSTSGCEGRGNIVSSRQLQCRYMGGNLIRTKEDGAVVGAPCKKIR
ncbi:hypothetical protein Tsubulata_011930 [Turnera subulata]|uniref:Uncharacterized protein n=1 Tax=Turnera subulata TaxID=218843 RepID=A0A9Q0GM39_9ROSI|nr:hypothetical protein Tsubulata_011930 [Turnera subulata]